MTLKVKADEFIEAAILKAYEDGYNAGVKATKGNRTKEINAAKKKLEDLQMECSNLAFTLNELAGPHGSWEM